MVKFIQVYYYSGGVSKSAANISMSRSIIDFKNYEEQTLRDAINSMINFTIQDSELHGEFSL